MIPDAAPGHDDPVMTAVPLGRVAHMTVTTGSPRSYKTIPQLLDWHRGIAKERYGGRVKVGWCRWSMSIVRQACEP